MNLRHLGPLSVLTATTVSLLTVFAPMSARAAAPNGGRETDGVVSKGHLKAAQLLDVAPNHWAYTAIQELMEKYRIMGAYPDRTFRGQRTVTRYEIAAMLANVMDRFEHLEDAGTPATIQDVRVVDRLKDDFKVELVDLNTRLLALETASKSLDATLADLKARAGLADKVKGTIGVTVEDDPEDRLKPFVVTNFEVKFGSDLDANTSYSASITGGNPAAASGGTPVFTRGGDKKDKGLPNGNMTLNGNAQITTKVAGVGASTFKVGEFTPGTFVGLGGFAHHYGDGIIGSGLAGPSGNTVRTGGNGQDIGVGTKITAGNLNVGAGLNTQFLFGGLSYALGSLGDVNVIADGDHNSIGNVALEGDPAYHFAGSVDLGSDKLGLSLQLGMTYAGTKTTPKAGLNFITNVLGAELCLGGTYKTDVDQTTGEMIPTGYVYYPAKGFVPSVLFGAKEPETLFSSKGQSGPGSLLGSKAGWTLQFGIPNPLMPNLTLEFDMQSNLLLGDYDGWGYAISTSTDF